MHGAIGSGWPPAPAGGMGAVPHAPGAGSPIGARWGPAPARMGSGPDGRNGAGTRPCPVPGPRGDVASIVCAVKESPSARAAVRVAAGLGSALSGRLVLVHVTAVTDHRVAGLLARGAGAPDAYEALRARELRRAEELLRRVARDCGVDGAERHALAGAVVERLAWCADRASAVLLVAGSSGRWRLGRGAGPVLAELGARAPCPLVVVPAPPRGDAGA